MREYRLFIDGAFVQAESKQTFDSINPFSGEVVAKVARAGTADAQRAVLAARKAFDEGVPPGAKRTLEGGLR